MVERQARDLEVLVRNQVQVQIFLEIYEMYMYKGANYKVYFH